ncbi:hypothetical protein ACFSFW_07460 [Fredinandcohnia salidurans]|uniref:Uncharacterized protein n=1 Tax=Fredinandcohnia salidurans TaxID=2595041 RepID=A0ABW4MKF2_9BACI
MKKRVPLLLFLLLFLSACTENSGTPIVPNENNMIIRVKNNADFEIYGLELDISNHTQGTINADGSKLEKGDELLFEFLEGNFHLEGEGVMTVFILTDNHIEDNGDRIPLNQKETFDLGSNKEIVFELTGETISKAEFKRLK